MNSAALHNTHLLSSALSLGLPVGKLPAHNQGLPPAVLNPPEGNKGGLPVRARGREGGRKKSKQDLRELLEEKGKCCTGVGEQSEEQ